MTTPLVLDPDLRWLLQRVAIAELGDLDATAPTREAREAVGALTDEHFATLLGGERERLGLTQTTPGDGWPTPLAQALAGLVGETPGGWDRLTYRLRDAFEVLVKYLAAVTVSDVLERASVPQALRDDLARHLERPSLGHWIGFLRAGLGAGRKGGAPAFVPEIEGYFDRVLTSPAKGPNPLSEFQAMRNEYAHGATPQMQSCRAAFEDKLPSFVRLFSAAAFLKRYPLVGFDEKGAVLGRGPEPTESLTGEAMPYGTTLLRSPSRPDALPLSPLLVYRLCLGRIDKARRCHRRLFLFYNDQQRKGIVTLLDYPSGHQSRDSDLFDDFVRRLPLDAWKAPAEGTAREADHFDVLVEEKTRDFVGRRDEVAQVRRWAQTNASGFCLIRGNPGVGKSALMSALSRAGSDVSAGDDPELAALLSRDAWAGIDVVSYFIVRGSRTARPAEFLASLLRRLGGLYDLRCAVTGNPDELARELEQQLLVISGLLRQAGRKLVLLIDGLDEAVSAEGEVSAGESLLRQLPRDVPPGVFVVLAGRRRKEVEALRAELHREKVFALDLAGLGEADVRALLQLAISKYELKPQYVAEVTRLSEGNPLYVKLLMESLIEGHLRVNDVDALPENLRALYADVVQRIVNESSAALPVLMTLALAREQLRADQIGGMTGQTEHEARRNVALCLEVLTERRGMDGRSIYRVFHDSFGDYLRADYASLVPETSRQILRFVARAQGDQPAEPELLAAVERLTAGAELGAADAPALSRVIERATRTLTGHHLVLQSLTQRPAEKIRPLLTALAQRPEPATGRLAIQCLVAAAEQDPASVGRAMVELVEKPMRGKSQAIAQANLQAARVALEASVGASHLPALAADVRRVLLAVCASDDASTRSLGALALFRLVQTRYEFGQEILNELGRQSVRFGMVRRGRLEAFVGCAVGLLFNSPHDARLTADLKQSARGVISRVWGLRLALWLVPAAAAALWNGVPDDYNPVNLAEFKGYKKYAAAHPEFVASVNELLEWMDPTHGTSEEFIQAMYRLNSDPGPPQTHFCLMPMQGASISRALLGDEAVLEAIHEAHTRLPRDHQWRQEFLYRMRLIQVARRLRGQPPLGPLWTGRVETAVREFMHDSGGVFDCIYPGYAVGGVGQGTMFLAQQHGHGRLPIVEELIRWSASKPSGKQRPPERARHLQVDAVLLRLLEVLGSEFGVSDPLAREVVFFGLSHFLDQAATFDDWFWERLATVLVRMNFHAGEEVVRFLADVRRDHRERLEALMNRILPREGIGLLLAAAANERCFALILSEPADEKDGLRAHWREFVRTFLGPASVSVTLRDAAERTLRAIR